MIALLLAALLGGGFMWFRDSSFAAVQRVRISGLNGPGAAEVEAALGAQARRMSTLDYSASALERAVAPLHVVRSLHVSASFPHTMRIIVSEQPPVARLSAGGREALVAGDGIVLGSLNVGALPSIDVPSLPTPGEPVLEAQARGILGVLGAAPAQLLRYVASAYSGAQGVTLRMRDGLIAYFGTPERAQAKWDALVAVLASPSSAGASYIDVRMPERPAAGMPGGTGESSALAQVNATDPSSALLAESLARALNGESPIEQSTSATVTAPSGGAASSTQSESTSSAAGGEAAASSESEASSSTPATTAGEAQEAGSGEAAASPSGEAQAAPSGEAAETAPSSEGGAAAPSEAEGAVQSSEGEAHANAAGGAAAG